MYRRDQWKLVVPFIVPSLLIYAVLVIYPYIQAFYISLTFWRGVSKNMEFVGLDNFGKLLADPVFWQSLRNNVTFLVVGGLCTLILAMLVAAALTSNVRGRQVYRVVYFFPYAMSVVAVAVLWIFIYNPRFGILQSALKSVGLGGIVRPWLGDPATSLYAVIVTFIWASMGFYMVLFMAGIQNVPADLLDAARVDGASKLQSFFNVTIPLLWEVAKTATVFSIIGGLNQFALTQIMTMGGPSRASEVIGTYLYAKAFDENNFGYGASMAVSLFVMTLAITLLSQRFMRRDVIEF